MRIVTQSPVGAAERRDLLTLLFQDQEIAAFRSSYRGERISNVGAAEGCDLLTLLFQDQEIAAFRSCYRGEHISNVGAAEGCDLLTLLFQDQEIAAFRSSCRGERISNVGAAEGCGLLTSLFQDQEIAAFRSSYRGGTHFNCRSCRRLRSFDFAVSRSRDRSVPQLLQGQSISNVGATLATPAIAGIKKPRDRMIRGAKNWLVAANQRSSLTISGYLLATVSGCQPPPRAL
ncbi:hypothetical protein PS718_03405 [Pseudomonas fluorescens]|uniref:Uncharacterized protein n=1 Tax=Pseudomonas fluorescens TaxID=294 RepID=A0A5E7CZF9_PSEFL|nr:hypothetical protein PS718_03405 [Pseudomonas fluorescens]